MGGLLEGHNEWTFKSGALTGNKKESFVAFRLLLCELKPHYVRPLTFSG